MFHNTIVEILSQTWPMLLICSVILISTRIVYLIKYKVSFTLYKELLKLSFIIYVMCLFYVVTFQDVSWSSSNFIPFKEMFRYPFASHLFFKNVLGNLLMFVPYGFFVSYFLKLKKPWSIFLLCVVTSVTIEITQFWIGRVFDVDDIMLNILGGMIGFSFYYIIDSLKQKFPEFLKKPLIYNILMVALVILALSYLICFVGIGG